MIHDSTRDIETPSRGLRIGTCGWQQALLAGDFYPDDLPEDWRLNYYANEFSCVLVPVAEWQAVSEVDDWLDDVPGDFRFYLQAPDDMALQARLVEIFHQLGDRCGGVIGDQPQAGLNSVVQYCLEPGDSQARPLWTPGQPCATDLAMVSLQQTDIKTWRHWLERFGQDAGGHPAALLVRDPEPDMPRLQELKTLAELMGF